VNPSTAQQADASLPQAAQRARRLAARLGARLVETHISWVLLGPTEAFKLKKPLRTPFLDYATIERRRACCDAELRLNVRLAAGLYLGLARITGTDEDPAIDGCGDLLDWAVRMRRFDDEALFGNRLSAGILLDSEVDAAADLLARFHQGAARAVPQDNLGTPRLRTDAALAACAGAAAFLEAPAGMEAWLRSQAQRLTPCWQTRLRAGCIREVHGDLHLDNLLWLDGAPAAFDCIEFDASLRWIDVADDIAFPVMDLAARGRGDLALRLLNRWLDATGDHGTLPLLRFSLVYRALVRAQVAGLRGDEEGARRYARAATGWTRTPALRLTAMHGLPGSGKTHVSQHLLQEQQAIRLRADVERKRLFGLGPLEDSRARGLDIYTPEAGRRTYARLLSRAAAALRAGFPVILDAAHLHHSQRERARGLAARFGAEFRIAHCEAPAPLLRARIQARRNDASEADERVLEHLRQIGDPITPEESAWTDVHGV